MKTHRRLVVAVLVTLVTFLTVGATSAFAHGPRHGSNGANANALAVEAAKQLGVTTDRLQDSIVDAAIARIDEAVEDEDVDAEDADELKEQARDSLRYAMKLSRTRAVASNLDIRAAKLNAAFRAARKALIVARIDEAVQDGDLEADEAAELKDELEQMRLPGYKAVGLVRGFGGGGLGFGCAR